MRLEILTIFALIKSYGVFANLKCSVNNAVVSLQLNTSSPSFQKDVKYFVRTTNLHTKRTAEYPGCIFINNMKLNCSIWRSNNDDPDDIKEYYYSPYLLQVIDRN